VVVVNPMLLFVSVQYPMRLNDVHGWFDFGKLAMTIQDLFLQSESTCGGPRPTA